METNNSSLCNGVKQGLVVGCVVAHVVHSIGVCVCDILAGTTNPPVTPKQSTLDDLGDISDGFSRYVCSPILMMYTYFVSCKATALLETLKNLENKRINDTSQSLCSKELS